MKKVLCVLLSMLLLLGSWAVAETTTETVLAKLNDRGDVVREIQEKLIALKLLNEKADGIFGKNTQAAVKAFEKAQSLPETGVVTQALLDQMADALRRKGIAHTAQFTMLFNTAELVAGSQAQIDLNQVALTGDVTSTRVPVGASSELAFDILADGNIASLTLYAKPYGSTAAADAARIDLESTLIACGLINTRVEAETLLTTLGILVDNLLVQTETNASAEIDGLSIQWAREGDTLSLAIQIPV